MTIEQFNKAKSCFSRKEKVEDILQKLTEYKSKSGSLYFKSSSYGDKEINLDCPANLMQNVFQLIIDYYTSVKTDIDTEIENI